MTVTLPPLLAQAVREQLTGGRQWPSPGDLAQALDRRIRRTPALELVNAALVEAFNTPDARLAISIAPQEGKGLALDTKSYADLSKPSSYVKPITYGTVTPGLFNAIATKGGPPPLPPVPPATEQGG